MMNFKWVVYGGEDWKRMTQTHYLDYCGNKVPYGWITWEVVEFNGINLAKMVWTRF